jgi:hypothetical protein
MSLERMRGRDPIASRTLYTKSGLPKGILDARNNDRPAKTSAFAMLSHYRGGEGPWSKLRSISLGAHVFLNLTCVILNVVAVRFSAGTLIGPAVQIYTADHPRDPLVRRSGAEFGRLIAIGRNVWIGGGAIILPGVTIDDDATIRLSPIPRLIELFGLYICLGLPANANSPFEPLYELSPHRRIRQAGVFRRAVFPMEIIRYSGQRPNF